MEKRLSYIDIHGKLRKYTECVRKSIKLQGTIDIIIIIYGDYKSYTEDTQHNPCKGETNKGLNICKY